MRRWSLILAAAVGWKLLLLGDTNFAQQPSPFETASLLNSYGSMLDDEFAPENTVVAEEPTESEPTVLSHSLDRARCGLAHCSLGEAWTLFSQDNPRGIKVGGYTQIGYHTQGLNVGATGTGPLVFDQGGDGLFNNYPNRIQAQQVAFYIGKEASSDEGELDWGFRMDYIYGTDGLDTQAFGGRVDEWDNGWDNGFAYGNAIPQLYVEAACGNVKLKLGHFFTIAGYESVPAINNFFYSHSYSMVLTEPFTHGGVLAEHSVTDKVTVYAGYTMGWDTAFSTNGGDVFIGGISWNFAEDATFTYVAFGGDLGYGGDNDAYTHSIVFDWNVSKRVEIVLQNDLIVSEQFTGVPGGTVVSLNNYLFYKINDCVKAGFRGEWWNNEGLADDIFEFTFGVNYRPTANMVFRPEVRLDDYGTGWAGTLRDSTVFGMDAIITY